MPIPKDNPWWWRLRAWLTWATIEQAVGEKPLTRSQRFWRAVSRHRLPLLLLLLPLTGCMAPHAAWGFVKAGVKIGVAIVRVVDVFTDEADEPEPEEVDDDGE